MPQVKVSTVKLQSQLTHAGNVKVTRVQGNVQFSDRSLPARITRAQVNCQFNDRTLPIRVTRQTIQILQSVELAPIIERDFPPLLNREANPYRPTLPPEVETVSQVLYNFMREQSELIRQQHNIIQAGDSTVPWEFLTKTGVQPQFTPGSLGRFYHDDYGVIIARYCQFTRMAETQWGASCCGRLRDSKYNWIVTNDINESSASDLVGVIGSFKAPMNDSYGWVIVQGTNIAPLLAQADAEALRFDEVVWTGVERVGLNQTGLHLGWALTPLVKINPVQRQFEPGTVDICVGGPGLFDLKQLNQSELAELANRLGIVETTLTTLSDLDLAALADKIANFNARFGDLSSRISQETAARARGDSELSKRLSKLEVAGSYAQAISDLQLADTNLTQALNTTNTKVTALTARVGALEQLDAKVDAALELIQLVNQRTMTDLIPVVDGGLPPQLVYLPNGELLFMEIPR